MKSVPESLLQLQGQGVHAVDTPSLVIDLDAMERNLTRMAEFAARHQVRLRPHAKTHKSAMLARLQLQAGAVGVCVQKTSEAEALAAMGVHDIFISNQVIAQHKLARVAQLAQRLQTHGGKLAIAIDGHEGICRLSQAMADLRDASASIDVFIEIDVGQGRCGVQSGQDAVVLAQTITGRPHLRFAGLHAYHGKAQHLRDPAERRRAIAAAVQQVRQIRALIKAAGISVELVTGAGTGTFSLEAASGVYGELQAGSFMFMDAAYALNDRDPAQPVFEHALFVKSQVISVNGNHAVCDAGHKSHAIDSGLPRVHGLPPERSLRYENGGDEHGILYSAQPSGALPVLGQVLWLIPGHCDPTVNLHDHMIGVRGGLANGIVERIIRVDARGALV